MAHLCVEASDVEASTRTRRYQAANLMLKLQLLFGGKRAEMNVIDTEPCEDVRLWGQLFVGRIDEDVTFTGTNDEDERLGGHHTDG
jgi:hypothetical protein